MLSPNLRTMLHDYTWACCFPLFIYTSRCGVGPTGQNMQSIPLKQTYTVPATSGMWIGIAVGLFWCWHHYIYILNLPFSATYSVSLKTTVNLCMHLFIHACVQVHVSVLVHMCVCVHEYEHLCVHVSVYVCVSVKDRTQQTTPARRPQAQLWPSCPSEYIYPKLGASWIATNVSPLNSGLMEPPASRTCF